MKKIILGLFVLGLLIVSGLYFFKDSEDELVIVDNNEIEVSETISEVKEFSVDATGGFSFSVQEMRVNVGDTVRINLTNTDNMPHDLIIEEFNVATAVLNRGESDTIEFIASEPGIFEYYCAIGSHRQMGMVGSLIVE